jgi:hypothetical protein
LVSDGVVVHWNIQSIITKCFPETICGKETIGTVGVIQNNFHDVPYIEAVQTMLELLKKKKETD